MGAGTWGIALARLLAVNGHQVTVWSAIPSELDQLEQTGVHPNLPDMVLPQGIIYNKEMGPALEGSDLVLFAVPSVFVRSTAEKAKPYINGHQILVDVAKGVETPSLLTMTGILRDVLGNVPAGIVALSGPTHAEEVSLDLPTAIVSACEDEEIAKKVQDIFMNNNFRVYTNTDVTGVEIGGALKNIIALGAGISDGMGYGDNAKAAMMTRGLTEIARLGIALGAEESTFFGLTGIGDLIVTCTSLHSRNRRCGMLIGQGHTPAEASKTVGMVVEGMYTTEAAYELARTKGIQMPITEHIYEVIQGRMDAREAVRRLMTRKKKHEREEELIQQTEEIK